MDGTGKLGGDQSCGVSQGVAKRLRRGHGRFARACSGPCTCSIRANSGTKGGTLLALGWSPAMARIAAKGGSMSNCDQSNGCMGQPIAMPAW